MRGRRLTHARGGLCGVIAVVIAAVVVCAPRGVLAAPTPEASTVVIFTYHGDGGSLRPSSVFTGVLLNAQQVLTSSAALQRGHGNLIRGYQPGQPQYVLVVVPENGQQLKVPATVVELGADSPLALLALDPMRAGDLQGKVNGGPAVTPLAGKSALRVIGVPTPWGDLPEEVTPQTIPPAVPVSLELSAPGASADLAFPLPRQFAGAGAWDAEGKLAGIVVHEPGRWRVVDVTAAVQQAQNILKQKPAVAAAPDGPMPSGTVAELPPRLRGLAEMMSALGLTLRLPPDLLDYVGQEQADLVMSYLAAGRFDKAQQMLDELESLASGTLAEQLNYRRALLAMLQGDYKLARDRAAATLGAQDALVRGRGRMLYRVLETNPEGAYAMRPLKDPLVLREALLAEVIKAERPIAAAWNAARAQQLVSKNSFEVINQKLDQVASAIEQYQHSWPGHFDQMSQQLSLYRQQLVRDEYVRVTDEMQKLHAQYQTELARTEFKQQGPSWSQAGHWPPERVGAVNVTAERYNELLEHRQKLEAQLTQAERRPLPMELAEPLKRLTVAKQPERG